MRLRLQTLRRKEMPSPRSSEGEMERQEREKESRARGNSENNTNKSRLKEDDRDGETPGCAGRGQGVPIHRAFRIGPALGEVGSMQGPLYLL